MLRKGDAMKEELTKKIDAILSESFFIDDAVVTMRGLSIMIQEFMNGNTWPGIPNSADRSERFWMERLSDMLYFTSRTLELTADSFHEQYVELENKLLRASSCKDATGEGGE